MKANRLKSRLAPALASSQRQKLARLMLLDVLDAVSGAGLIPSCFVVTSSRSIKALVEGVGATAVMEDSDTGVNPAVEAGLSRARADDVVVVPSDLPLLKASEIKAALALKASGMDVVVAPSMDYDGTNLLAFSLQRPLALSFDRDSFWNHLSDASRRGYRVGVYSGKGVRFDLDTVFHLRQLSKIRSSGRAAAFAREAARR